MLSTKTKSEKLLYEDPLIKVDGICVKFARGNPVKTIADLWDSFFSRKKNRDKPDYFWALKDISFEVRKGEILGLIGNNGAGKSTLLRVAAGILPPDKGKLEVQTQRNLLSPGLGYREQLTGRENIILGCLYLGHSIKKIEQNFDSMVEFSELGDHIDRPVRYYSDGMISRLTFTIATSIKADFLLMDELLSAGDISFRRKASKKMKEVVKQSNGAIIATHDMPFVEEHCTKVLYLVEGERKFYGDPREAVELYKKDIGL